MFKATLFAPWCEMLWQLMTSLGLADMCFGVMGKGTMHNFFSKFLKKNHPKIFKAGLCDHAGCLRSALGYVS